MSGLFRVSVSTMALAVSLVVARPPFGRIARRAIPPIVVVLLVPILAFGTYTTIGSPQILPDDVVPVLARGVGGPPMSIAVNDSDLIDLLVESTQTVD